MLILIKKYKNYIDLKKVCFIFQDILILARIGVDDRIVYLFYVRRMYRLMKEIKVNIIYMEIYGKEYWWWDIKYKML